MRAILSAVLLAGVTLLISGCQSLSYYAQSVKGQWQVIHRSKPIDDWLVNSSTPVELKQKLERVKEIRKFASSQLNLPENKSYTSYADLNRPFVVWTIFAAPELSLEPYSWCYPIIGCQAYRGYFTQKPAINLANELKDKGYDVSVGGVKAYSTLGWFNDPILNTFIHYSDVNLAGLIFHELSHQIVYVNDDTVFNESFATMVEAKGVEIWLRQNAGEDQLAEYKQTQILDGKALNLIAKYKQMLDRLYSSEVDEQHKRQRKVQIFSELKSEYQQFKQQFDFASPWDNWFAQDLNNAHLVAVGTYYDKVDEFEKLFIKSDQNFARFFMQVKKLAKFKKTKRDQLLANLDIL